MAELTDDEFLGVPKNSTPQNNGGMSDEDFLKAPPKPKEQKYGALESGLAGLESGVTAGWGDEIRAAGKASGIPDVIRNHVPGSSISAPLIGAARLAYEHLTGQPGEASRVYDETVKAHRERSKGMQEEHPWAYGAGDLAGSILPMAAFPMEGAATIPAKMAQAAKAGAAYGAVSGAGEGEGLKDSAIGAGVGAVAGGLGGAAAVPVGEAASWLGKKAYDYTAGPIVNTIKGLANPEKEAQRRFVGSVVADAPQVASGKAQGLTPQDWAQAYADGEPVMLGDLGGARTKALLRSSTNNSPEGRDIAESAIGDRFFTQADRVGSTIRGLVDGGANAAKTKAQLQAEYDAERNIAYTRAYDNGDRPINSPELERLMGSKAVGTAVRDAIENGQDRAIAQGYSGAFRSPYTVTPDGRVVKNPGTSGVPAYPNLAFWDQTYRSLRDSADQAFRAGRNNEGGALKTMANSMRSELDRMVPSYANARGIASTYFGGSSALEAGQKAVTSNAPIEKLRQAMSKMGPAEKEMFQEAYADTWASNIEKAPRNRDLTNRADLANSINSDRKLGVVFGQQKADRIAALAQREKIYDASRKVLGNSTTVRQMIEAGLAGGAIGSFLDGGQGGLYGAVTGAGSMLHHAPRALVKTATGYVNRNVAKHVAELYTSDDPMKVQRGLAMIAKNQSLRDGFARIRGELEKVIGATQASDQANKQRASGGSVVNRDEGGEVPSEYNPASEAELARNVAASRMRHSVAPEGGREEGVGTDLATKFIPALANKAAQVVTSGLTAPHDALTGDLQVNDPETGMPSMQAIQRAKDFTSIPSLGGFGTVAATGAEKGALGIVPVPVAKSLNVESRAPSDLLKRAAEGTPGAKIDENGHLIMDLVRKQKPDQAGEESVRHGVFYLPAGEKKNIGLYGKDAYGWYGGQQQISGTTAFKNPILVKGATGGKAPEMAYETVNGKGSFKQLQQDVLNAAFSPQKDREIFVDEFLQKHAPDMVGLESHILDNSTKGNQLRFALQEAAIAHSARKAGYDGILGYSTRRDPSKSPFITEVFDIREKHYPDTGGGFRLNPQYEKDMIHNRADGGPIAVDVPEGTNPLGGRAWNITPSDEETDINFNDKIGQKIQQGQAEEISNLFHRIPEEQATTSYEPRGVRGGIHRTQEGFSHHSPHEPSKDLDFLQWIEGSQPDVKKDWADGKAVGGRVTNSAKTRKESHYSATRGNTEHHCGPVKEWSENSCIHYKAGNKCNIVGGFIANRGGCDWFKNIKNRANGEAKINHSPSEAQKEAGNYKKDHISIHGLNISIENAKGSVRSGISKDGKKWSVKMPAQYGYIKGSTGADEDHIDVYVGPNHKSDKVFVVNQKDAETGAFDEHKSFICFSGLPQVKNTFMKAFSDGKGKNRMGHITEMSILEFKKFIEAETDRNTKAA